MPNSRAFVQAGSQAGVFHVVSRVVDRTYRLGEREKDEMVRLMRALADFHQVEILTYCLMSNHFHLLVRVPRRPAGFDLPLAEVLALLERSVGRNSMKLVRSQLEIYRTNGSEQAIEDWRQQQLSRMFSLSNFVKTFKQQFTQWYNRKNGRTGTLWEGVYQSVAVEDAERALRTMATYIDLNPVRAGMVDDPGAYRWCGYAAAMTGDAQAVAGLVKVTGNTTANVYGQAPGAPDPALAESPAMRRRRELRAMVAYRQLLGLAGRPRIREDGTVVRRGVSAKVRDAWEARRGVKREMILRRVQHFTRGVLFGSREFVNEWFERNRDYVKGSSRTTRKTGARPIGKAKDWGRLSTLREV